MVENEYSGRNKAKKRDTAAILRPVLGLIIILIGGALAFFASQPLADALRPYIGQLPADQEPILRAIVGVGIFIIVVLIFSLIGAVMAPKPNKMATEKQLEREKREKEKERIAARKRKKEMRAKMKAARKKQR